LTSSPIQVPENPAREASLRKIRMLPIAPSMDILGGQAVQATRLLAGLGRNPSLEMDFQPINPRVGWLRRVKVVRTVLTFLRYCLALLVRVPRYDILHVFSASYYSYCLWTLPALFFTRLYGKKIILNYRDGQAEDHLSNWKSALPSIRRMDALVTPSPFVRGVFARHGLDIRVIPNVLDIDRFPFRQRGRLRPVFLHNRILEPLYRVDVTLRAFAIIQSRYPEARLTVAHDGVSRPGLEALARELGLRNVGFVGRVPHARIRELYDEADIYLTNPDFDCLPGSLLECFASGLPVVATRVGGIPQIAADGEAALLVPCGDPEALAAAAMRLLEDPGLAARLTAHARQECRKYAAGPICEQWARVYGELV
jgi:glycosyltransferase involved in cell wall biosynthesis